MFIIISPAKTFQVPENKYSQAYVPLHFQEDTRTLISQLSRYSVEELQQLMKISKTLAEVNVQRYKNFFNPGQEGCEAIYSFYGEAYKALQAATLDSSAIDFMEEHVNILSGLYGILKPLDIIQAYRLEMGTSLNVGENKNLYEFWRSRLTTYVMEALKCKKENRFILNLASEEYSKALDIKLIEKDYPVIQVSFKEGSAKGYKVVGMYAKRARGEMLRFICDNKLKTLEDLKQFSQGGYSWNKDLSSEKHLVFTREKQNH